ncbi:MAG TPA: hypothetical protein VL727_28535 [Puia sp.]|nr:hypothetical protein [Puia sp.]
MSTRSVNSKISFSIAFLILCFLFSTLAVNAQSAQPAQAGQPARSTDSTRTPEGRAAALTEKMKTELALTEDQYPSVQAINLKYALKNEQIFKGSDGKFAKYRALKSSQKDKSREMKGILTSDQYKKYEAMTEEMKNKAMEQYNGRSGTGN